MLDIGYVCDLVVEVTGSEFEEALRVLLLDGRPLFHERADVLQELDLLAVLGLELGQLILIQLLHVLGIGPFAGRGLGHF